VKRALLLALVMLVGCGGRGCASEPASESEDESVSEGEGEGEGEGESESESEVEVEGEAALATCTLSTTSRSLETAPPDARAVAVAVSATGRTLVVVDRDDAHVDLLLVDDEHTVGSVPLEMAGAHDLFALEAVAGERFLLLTRDVCTAAAHASPCLVARAIDASHGAPHAGEPSIVLLPGELRSSRVVAAGASVYVARAHRGAAPMLDRFDVGDALGHAATRIGDGVPSLDEEPTEILGLTASGGGYAIVWRHGATEDARSAVTVSTQLDEHEVGALHDALVVESIAWLAGSLSIVASLEFARPSYVRLGADGELLTPPALLRFGEEPPAPFTGRRVAVLLGSSRELGVQIRNGAGDELAERMPLGESTVIADVARTEDGFVVASLDRTEGAASVALRSVACPSTIRSERADGDALR
jgi:hypothetical protein